jgi:hypothetical protein
MSVVVRVQVNSKKQSNHWSLDENGNKQINTEIDMNTVYTSDKNDPNYIFSALSGGTKFILSTINQDAANQFELDGVYEATFTKVK